MSHLDLDTATGRLTRKQRYNLLDGIDSQAGSSQPAVRSDGTVLQTGDRWLDTSDRSWWWWNGTYWLSEQIYTAAAAASSVTMSTAFGILPVSPSVNLFLLNFEFVGRYNSMNDATNYWSISLLRMSSSNISAATEASFDSKTFTAATQVFSSITLNSHRDVGGLGIVGFRLEVLRVGLAGALAHLSARLTYRLAKAPIVY